MAWTSAAPAVLDAILEVVAAAVPGTNVYDGMTVTGSSATEAIVVGGNGDGSAAISHEYDQQTLAGYSNVEQFTIANLIRVANTAGDLPAARSRAYELLGLFTAAIEADPTLGGLAMQAVLGEVEYQPSNTAGAGALARLTATVHVQAWRLP